MEKPMPVRGRYTYACLDDFHCLFKPWEMDPWGRLRPVLSCEALRLSLELAASAYSFKLGAWLSAGWTDMSIQVDNRLYCGITRTETKKFKAHLKNVWHIYKARRDLKQSNPVSQLLSAMRQKDQSDTCKALVMLHRGQLPGRYVVAIGFMGTGKRFYDWFSNFRMTSDGGFHQGFLQLARQFEENEEKIRFPHAAEELGLEKLSLRDVLQECRRPDSRFSLWLAGHSQGAAVMQMWTHLKIHEDGVMPMHLVGYGFASPTVANAQVLDDPAAYPLYHVLNSDDLVPRLGARVHMGVGLSYPSGEKIRNACYGWAQDESSALNRALMRRLTRRIVDAPTGLETALAFMELMANQPAEKLDENLSAIQNRFGTVKKLLLAADKGEEDLVRFMKRHAAHAYRSMTGREMDMQRVEAIQAEMEAVDEQIGFREMTRALQELVTWSHSLVGKNGYQGAYRYIVMQGTADLQPFIWQSGPEPMRLWLEALKEAQQSAAEATLAVWNRHLPKVRRRLPAHRHHGYLSRRR